MCRASTALRLKASLSSRSKGASRRSARRMSNASRSGSAVRSTLASATLSRTPALGTVREIGTPPSLTVRRHALLDLVPAPEGPASVFDVPSRRLRRRLPGRAAARARLHHARLLELPRRLRSRASSANAGQLIARDMRVGKDVHASDSLYPRPRPRLPATMPLPTMPCECWPCARPTCVVPGSSSSRSCPPRSSHMLQRRRSWSEPRKMKLT